MMFGISTEQIDVYQSDMKLLWAIIGAFYRLALEKLLQQKMKEYSWKGTTAGGEQLAKIGKLHWANLAGNENLAILELLTKAFRMLKSYYCSCGNNTSYSLSRIPTKQNPAEFSWGMVENISSCNSFPCSSHSHPCECIRMCSEQRAFWKPTTEPVRTTQKRWSVWRELLLQPMRKMECASLEKILKSHERKINCSENKLLNWLEKRISVLEEGSVGLRSYLWMTKVNFICGNLSCK
ncbi:hypothetical protein U0070_006194 [Myodes glareolus]|uniref:Uncharacterized protein n=1 Tax=Myodes glareolus TaxID=447135 RepID=A0AAW0HI95_MYOGA